jgi:endonuclease/exonuclease/phosphatase family metal-dependent hydrolase
MIIRPLALLFLTCTSLLAGIAPLNIISYNIRQDTKGDTGARDWLQRKDKLTDYLRNNKASIIGMQEVRHKQLIDITKALPDHSHVGVGRDDGKKGGEYSPILYDRKIWKLDPKEHGTFWLSDTPDVPNSRTWGNNYTRICSWARLTKLTGPKKGDSIYIYNTHWDHRNQPSRVKSGELILKTIKARSHQQDPFILMGDFNAHTDNPSVQQLLTSGMLIDHGKQQALTSSGWKPVLLPGSRIDHIFTSTSIKKAQFKIDINLGVQGHSASDHHPVLLSLPALP